MTPHSCEWASFVTVVTVVMEDKVLNIELQKYYNSVLIDLISISICHTLGMT